MYKHSHTHTRTFLMRGHSYKAVFVVASVEADVCISNAKNQSSTNAQSLARSSAGTPRSRKRRSLSPNSVRPQVYNSLF